MSCTKYKKGDVLTIKEGSRSKCGNFIHNNGHHIRIRNESCGYYSYDILDEYEHVVSGCCGCFTDDDLTLVHVEEITPLLINRKETIMPTNTKKVCEVIFTLDKGEQLLFIKSSQELANLFKSPDGVSTSDNYFDKDGNKLKYQKETPKLEKYLQNYRKVCGTPTVLNRYGTNLMVDGYNNFSILRTDNISEGITVKVNDLILEDDVTKWVQNLTAFLKFLHRNFIEKVEIKAIISIEM